MARGKKIVLQQLKDFQNQYECLIKLRKLKRRKTHSKYNGIIINVIINIKILNSILD